MYCVAASDLKGLVHVYAQVTLISISMTQLTKAGSGSCVQFITMQFSGSVAVANMRVG